MATSTRNLRACLVCSFVQSSSKFSNQGCPNCEEFLEMRGSSEVVSDCTSGVFEGMIVLSDANQRSWVAKWQRLQGYVNGTYAVKVEGVLPEEYVTAVENAGVKYIPYVSDPFDQIVDANSPTHRRDGSANTDDQ